MPIIEIKKRKIKYTPYLNNMYQYELALKIEMSPTFRNVFKNNLTDAFIDDVRKIANPDHRFTENTIIMISGKTGTGKSLTAMSIGRICFKKFTHKNMFFYDQQILDYAKDFPQNTCLVRDENTNRAIFGLGSTRTAQQFTTMAETCRKHGLSLILIEPRFTNIPIAKILLETVDMDINNRITRLAVRDATTEMYMGAIYIPVLPESDPDWIEYNKQKDEFIASVIEGKTDGAKADYEKCANDILENEPRIHECRNNPERKAIVSQIYPTYTVGEINTIVTLIKMRLRDGDENKK